MGFSIIATRGTAKFLQAAGLEVRVVNKVLEGRPHIVDALKNGEVQLVFNTTEGAQALADSLSIRRTALQMKVPYYTTMAGPPPPPRPSRPCARAPLKSRPSSLTVSRRSPDEGRKV
jgi:hypothetical protein